MLAYLTSFLATPHGAMALLYLCFSICVLLFKARTPDEYARIAARNPKWFWTRWAALWQAMGALGLDPYKTGIAMAKVVAGNVIPAAAMQRGIALISTLDTLGGGGFGGGDPTTLPAIQAAKPSSPPQLRTVLRVFAAAIVALSMLLAACNLTPAQTKTVQNDVNTGLTVLQYACVLANAAFPEADIEEACGIEQQLAPVVQATLASAKGAGVSRARPFLVTCEQPDGGDVTCVKPWLDAAGHIRYWGDAGALVK